MDASLEISKEIIAVLRADSEINSFVGKRIYDVPPQQQGQNFQTKSPYISLGDAIVYTDDYDCIEAETISIQINVWSIGDNEAFTRVECSKIANLIRKVLKRHNFTLSHNAFVSIEHQTTRIIKASDGITRQAALNYEIRIDAID